MMSELDSKVKENEILKNKTKELNSEVSKLLEELEKGEQEMNKKQVKTKIANSNLGKLEKVIQNIKVQKHEFIKISEAKVSELEKEIVAKDVKIDNLTKMQESLIADQNQNIFHFSRRINIISLKYLPEDHLNISNSSQVVPEVSSNLTF